jgi:hypothetical protein
MKLADFPDLSPSELDRIGKAAFCAWAIGCHEPGPAADPNSASFDAEGTWAKLTEKSRNVYRGVAVAVLLAARPMTDDASV